MVVDVRDYGETMKFRLESIGENGQARNLHTTVVETSTCRYQQAEMWIMYLDAVDDPAGYKLLTEALIGHVWNQDGEVY